MMRGERVVALRVVAFAAAVVLSGLTPGFGANARPLTVEQYRHPKGPGDLTFNRAYMIGARDALMAYNRVASHKLFCMSHGDPGPNFDEANNIVLRWARKAGGAADLPLGRALLYGLKDAYPCAR